MRETGTTGISLELRLVVLLLVFSVTIILSISLILVATGVFNAGLRESAALFSKELIHLSQNINDAFSNLSLSSVTLAKSASVSIEKTLAQAGISPSELSKRPEVLEAVLTLEFGTLLDSLQQSKSSGAFLILNATVNPGISGAGTSKAGLYLKNMEAAAVHSAYYDIRYLRGPASIARSKKMTLLPQWEMEFQVSDADYFSTPVQTVQAVQAAQTGGGTRLPLSRLYYWCPRTEFHDSDSAMLCSVPLIASDGTIMGVAGFEMESMLFKSSYSPDNSSQTRIFCLLAPCEGDNLIVGKSMYAGSSLAGNVLPSAPLTAPVTAHLTAHRNKAGLNRYTYAENSYLGLDSRITLYPADSPYEKEEWTVALLVPEADLSPQMARQNRSIALLLLLLTGACVALSVRISRLYLQPVTEAFDTIRSKTTAQHSKTRIPEIDDLMEFLAKEDHATEEATALASGSGKVRGETAGAVAGTGTGVISGADTGTIIGTVAGTGTVIGTVAGTVVGTVVGTVGGTVGSQTPPRRVTGEAARDIQRPDAVSRAHSTAMFETFVKNIKTLSKAERAVFDLYMEGHTAKEIAEILFLSINTIKTHNKRIYIKLNVSSRKELLVYIGMMQELEQRTLPSS